MKNPSLNEPAPMSKTGLLGASVCVGALLASSMLLIPGRPATGAIVVETGVAAGAVGTFRIRDDSAPLETDGGWLAATNTDAFAEAEQALRLRFEVDAVGALDADFKLQYARNSEGWTDVPVQSTPIQSGITPAAVESTPSAHFSDGASTTDLLSGSTGPFVPGESDAASNAVGPIDLADGEHTELEFAVRIRKFFPDAGGPVENVDGTTFDFRVVESDGAPLEAGATPRVTVDSSGLLGGTYAESPGNLLVKDTNGNLYFPVEAWETSPQIMMMKSSDGGRTWRAHDVANRPAGKDMESAATVFDPSTGIIHLIHDGGGNVVRHQFHTSDSLAAPDTWGVTDEQIQTYPEPGQNADQWVTAVLRSDGDLVVAYNGPPVASADRKAFVIVNSEGLWGEPFQVDDTSGEDSHFPWLELGADDEIHIAYMTSEAGTNANDDDGVLRYKTLSAAYAITTNANRKSLRSSLDTGFGVRNPIAGFEYFDDGGVSVLTVAYRERPEWDLRTIRIEDFGNPQPPKIASDVAVSTGQGASMTVEAHLQRRPGTKELHVVYVDHATHDVWYTTETNDGGWSSPDVELHDDVDGSWVRGLIFDHSAVNGGATVFGYVYDAGTGAAKGGQGPIYYSELDLAPIATGDAPVATDDTAVTDQDTAVVVDVAANDSDVDDNLDVSTATPITIPTSGQAATNNDGTITYTPDAGFTGGDEFDYQICDTAGLCDTATVSITVLDVNDAPQATDDTAVTDQDTAVVVDVAANDSDVDDNLDVSTATPITIPTSGQAATNNDGTITYTPDAGFTGGDQFDYQICDTAGLCDTATVSITVLDVNDAPQATDDTAVTDQDTAVVVDVAANDSDVDDNLDVSTATPITIPTSGQAVTNNDGTITYTPDNAGFTGGDEFDYQICDTAGLCDTATVSITVLDVNDAPQATDDTAVTDQDTAVVVDVAANDSDVDDNLDVSSATPITIPTSGQAVTNNDGTITYTPDAGFTGGDEFDYQICDTAGLCDTATVSITVLDVNDAPQATDDTAVTDQDTAVVVDVAANDSDVDDNLDVSTATPITIPTSGQAATNNDGTITYTPDAGFTGGDQFDYQICDTAGLCDTATVSITVLDVNDAPQATDDTAVTDQDSAVVVDVAANDSDVDDNLDVSSATPITIPTSGQAVTNNDGTITYTPDAGFTGGDEFDYQICDTAGLCDTATVSITVLDVNDAPQATDDDAVTDQDSAVVIDVAANDSDVDDNLDVSTATPITIPTSGQAVTNNDGTITYTPDAGFTGGDEFDYQICDTAGLCDTATVTVTVTASAVYYLSFESSVSLPGIAGTVSDVDVVAFDAASGTWSMVFDASDVGITSNDLDALHVRGDGTSLLLSFSSDDLRIPGLVGGPDGERIDDSDVILFTASSLGDTTAGSFSFYFDGSDVGLTSSSEDVDGLFEFADGSLGISTTGSISVAGLPSGDDEDVHRFTGSFGTVTSGSWALYFDGSDVGFTSSSDDLDAVSFDADDLLFSTIGSSSVTGGDDDDVNRFTGNFGNTTTGTATLELDLSAVGIDSSDNIDALHLAGTVTPPAGDAPVATDDDAVTDQDSTVVVDVAANDSDVDDNLDVSSATPITIPTSGQAVTNNDGTITYTPDAGFTGGDEFDYQICDTAGLCDTATVSITVLDVNDAPQATDDDAVTDQDTAVVVDVAANDSDVDDNLDVSTATPITIPTSGQAATNNDGTITYTPDTGFTGGDEFDYQICDTAGLCDTATVTVTVTASAVYYLSFESSVSLPGIAGTVSDVDVVAFDAASGTWSMVFDASDVGITSNDLDALHVRGDGTSLLLSFSSDDLRIPGLVGGPDGERIDDSDVILFTASSLGDTTAGSFSFYFDGSDVGLTSSSEDVDGLFEFADGSLGISTTGSISVAGLPSGDDEDVHRFTGSFGTVTSGSWALYFDGSDVGFTSSSDDLDAVSFDADDLLFSTIGSSSVTGGDDDDVNRFTGNFGNTTTGTATLELDLSAVGIDSSDNIDALHLAGTVTPPAGDAPVATDDDAVTDQDSTVVVDVAANDSDVDDNLDVSTATPITIPTSGQAVTNNDGTITYTPDTGFTGGDEFDYQICDTAGLCDTATVTVTVTASAVYYLSFESSVSLPGIAGTVSDVDVVAFDAASGTWSMVFDASDVGITSNDLDALHVRGDGTSLLLSFSSDDLRIPGLVGGPDGERIDDSDVILFTASSLGDTTAGSFSFYFDGSDVGLTSSSEDVDGLFEFADGSLGISTTGSISVAGLPSGDDEDVHRFTGSFGTVTSGSWALYFDGSDVGFTSSSDDLDAVSFDADDLLFSTIGSSSVTGGDDDDVNRFTGNFGNTTTGTATLELDLSAVGIDSSDNIDALHLAGTVTPPAGDAPAATDDDAVTDQDTTVVIDVAAVPWIQGLRLERRAENLSSWPPSTSGLSSSRRKTGQAAPHP